MTLLLVPPPVIMKYLGYNKSKAKITNKSAATHIKALMSTTRPRNL